jgi:microcystin-dependent protein
VPLHFSGGIPQGSQGGEETHTLRLNEIPSHQHQLVATTDLANASVPGNAVPAAKPRGGRDIYARPGSPVTPLDPTSVGATGSSQPHNNLQPYLTCNLVIALQGIFPTRS